MRAELGQVRKEQRSREVGCYGQFDYAKYGKVTIAIDTIAIGKTQSRELPVLAVRLGRTARAMSWAAWLRAIRPRRM